VVHRLLPRPLGRIGEPAGLLELPGSQGDKAQHHGLPGLSREGRAAGQRTVGVEQGAAVTAGQVVALARREPLRGHAHGVDVVQGGDEPSAGDLQAIVHGAGWHLLEELVVPVHGTSEAVVCSPPDSVPERIGAPS
jgi:hypothetical protein